jgi:hypothetical protein
MPTVSWTPPPVPPPDQQPTRNGDQQQRTGAHRSRVRAGTIALATVAAVGSGVLAVELGAWHTSSASASTATGSTSTSGTSTDSGQAQTPGSSSGSTTVHASSGGS